MSAIPTDSSAPQIIRLSANNPARPPAWRWQLAGLLLHRKTRPSADDRILRSVVEFRRDLAAADRAPDRDRAHRGLAARRPATYGAWDVFSDRNQTRRRLFEAYLLAGLTPADAGLKCGLSADAAVAFAAVFYDIGDRLGRAAFILAEAIGRPANRAGRAPDEYVWRLVAYRKGAAALEALLFGDLAGRTSAGPADVGQALDDLVDGAVRARTLRAATAPDSPGDEELLRVRLRQRPPADTTSRESREAYSLIKALGVGARYGGPAKVPEGVSAAEPRAAEMLGEALGLPVNDEYVPREGLTFPPPENPPFLREPVV